MTIINAMNYDIIGDIHGCHDTLIALLETLEYTQQQGCYQRPDRKVIFLGDFVDRGPQQLQVVDTVRAMVDAGHAYAVMGNHEFNAIAYATQDIEHGGFLRAHSERNARNHRAFLEAIDQQPERYAEVIEWFKTLPLWLELDGLRVIHACWDKEGIEKLKAYYAPDALLTDQLLQDSSHSAHWSFDIMDDLLKGKTIKLSNGGSFQDSGGVKRHYMRIRWWDRDASTYKAAFMGPPAALSHIEDDPIDGDHLIEYGHHEVPLFIGHYWMQGAPKPLTANIACVDYSIARKDGKLCAYRWDGESVLTADKFVCVPRLEP